MTSFTEYAERLPSRFKISATLRFDEPATEYDRYPHYKTTCQCGEKKDRKAKYCMKCHGQRKTKEHNGLMKKARALAVAMQIVVDEWGYDLSIDQDAPPRVWILW